MPDVLQDLADKSAIADLVHAYAYAMRKGKREGIGELFTEDGVFEVRMADPTNPDASEARSRAEGRAAVAEFIGGATHGQRPYPAIHNLMIRLDGDSASATSLMIATAYPLGTETTGEYEDSFRREGGEWRFSERIYTVYRAA